MLRDYKDEGFGWWLWVQDYVYADGQLLAGEREAYYGGVRHFHLDHLGTVRMITRSDRMRLGLHDFYPFGLEQTATLQEKDNFGFDRPDPMKYTGHERDFLGLTNAENTDYLDYMHARYYDPNKGRFLSVDAGSSIVLGQPQSWNRYSYALDNPIMFIDPDGLASAPTFYVTTTVRSVEYNDPRTRDYIRTRAISYEIDSNTATPKNFQNGLSQKNGVSLYFGHANAEDGTLKFNGGYVKLSDFNVQNRVLCLAGCNTSEMLDDVKIGKGQALIGVTSNFTKDGVPGSVLSGDLQYITTQLMAGLLKGEAIGTIVKRLIEFFEERAKKNPKYKVTLVLRGDASVQYEPSPSEVP